MGIFIFYLYNFLVVFKQSVSFYKNNKAIIKEIG